MLFITLGIYYITPWIRWDRAGDAPDQAVLLDLAHRRFYFFFIEIWPQEFFLVAGLLIMAGLGLFLITSIGGRVWCGYTCPQTVWVDLFIAVEHFFEGDRNARTKLEAQGWSAQKILKRTCKHLVWILIGCGTGGAWILYFADAPTLLVEFFTAQAAYQAYATFALLTATTYVFAAFMREQVCTYMCPWPRIQSALLDNDSITVTYRDYRGEPRAKGHRDVSNADSLGDCIDCGLCVAVCPMGIDIRDGLQLECINCGLCIDACTGVMQKIGKPKSWLIAYDTVNNNAVRAENSAENSVENQTGSKISGIHGISWPWARWRNLIYFTLWASIGVMMLFLSGQRDSTILNILQDRNPVVVSLSDGSLRNSYNVKIINRHDYPRRFSLDLGTEGMRLEYRGSEGNHQQVDNIIVEADSLRQIHIFVIAETLPSHTGIQNIGLELILSDDEGWQKSYETIFTIR